MLPKTVRVWDIVQAAELLCHETEIYSPVTTFRDDSMKIMADGQLVSIPSRLSLPSYFVLLVEVCKAPGDPRVFDVGLKKAVEWRLGRRARGVLPDNLFNPDAKRIVRELEVAVMDALKETLSKCWQNDNDREAGRRLKPRDT